MQKRTISPALLFVAFVLSLPWQKTEAQLSVQQPTVESFGVSTTVVVPDKGEIHLGSVGVARDARNFYGPRTALFPRTSSLSQERFHSGLSVRATIQDLSEMDRALLNKPDAAAPLPFEKAANTGPLSRYQYGLAEAPRPGALAPKHRYTTDKNRFASSPPLLKTGKTSDRIAQKYLQQGREAEKQGNKTLAKIYYRLAIRNGSREARDLLNRLTSRLFPGQ